MREAKLDPRWRLASTRDSNCYCPYCNAKLNDILPNAVELAKTLTLKNIVVFMALAIAWLLAIATGTVSTVGPISIILFGVFLAKSSAYRDHRIIGWFLVVAFTVLLVLMHGNV